MTISELVDRVKAAAGKSLESVPDGKARALVRGALAEIGKQIDAGGAEPVRIGGLGVFRTTEIPREKDGKKTVVKRVIFLRPPQPK